MLEAGGQVLPIAVGLAVSSLPLIVVVLTLVTGPRAGTDLAFLLGWLAGLGAVGAVAILFADAVLSESSQPRWANAARIVLGVVLIVLAVRQWRGRTADGPAVPAWMARLDSISRPGALRLGFLLSAVSPKNVFLTISGAGTIVAATDVVVEQVVALLVFVVVAGAGVATPVVAARVLGARVRDTLDTLKARLAEHNTAIVTVVLLVLGAVLVGNGVAGLG